MGPTSGAAFLVARWWAAANPTALTVVMLPDEGHRYTDTVYDDAWLVAGGHLTATLPVQPVAVADPRLSSGSWTSFAWGRRSYAEVMAAGGAGASSR